MKKISLPLMIACILLFSTKSFAQEKQPNLKNQLKIPALPFPLEWETKPETFKVTESGFIMEAGKGTDLYTSVDGSKNINNVPKLLFTPDSNFIFTAKVKPTFKESYDGGAIMVYHDPENWAKLLFEKNIDGTLGIWTTVSTNKTGDDNFNGFIENEEVFLKIAKADKAYCFYYSLDGNNWTVIRAFPLQNSPNAKIGFSSQSPLGSNCSVEFSMITYQAKKFTDFYSGQ